MSCLWNEYHSLESTDRALNFWLTQILSLNVNTQTQVSFVPLLRVEFSFVGWLFTLLWTTHCSSVNVMLYTFGSLWHLPRSDVTLALFSFLPQRKYLVGGMCLHAYTHVHLHISLLCLLSWLVIFFRTSFPIISMCLIWVQFCFFSSLMYLQFNIFSVFCWSAVSLVPFEMLNEPESPTGQSSSLGGFRWRGSCCSSSARVLLLSLCSAPALYGRQSPLFSPRGESVPIGLAPDCYLPASPWRRTSWESPSKFMGSVLCLCTCSSCSWK